MLIITQRSSTCLFTWLCVCFWCQIYWHTRTDNITQIKYCTLGRSDGLTLQVTRWMQSNSAVSMWAVSVTSICSCLHHLMRSFNNQKYTYVLKNVFITRQWYTCIHMCLMQMLLFSIFVIANYTNSLVEQLNSVTSKHSTPDDPVFQHHDLRCFKQQWMKILFSVQRSLNLLHLISEVMLF